MLGEAEEHAALAPGDPRGAVQQPVAQRFGFGGCEVTVEEGGLGPGEQVRGGENASRSYPLAVCAMLP